MVDISGQCPPGFGAVRDAFAENFEHAGDVGASVAVTLDGELVVDLWGGTLDAAGTVPWEADTIINVFSTTKTMSCLSLLVLASRGLVDVDAPVARYWPEFAAAGKAETVLVRHVLSHTAGLPAWDTRLDGADLYDWERVTGLLAAQAPWWEPGSRSGYHAITQGNLVGEIVRRVDGRSVGRFFAEEVAGPLGADFHIGTGPEHDDRVALVIPPTVDAPPALGGKPPDDGDRLDPAPGRQPCARRRAVVGDPVAAGRDPGGRWARQRPQRRPRPVGRLGRRFGPWCRAALQGGDRPDLRRPGRRARPRARHRRHVRRRLRAELAARARSPPTSGSATGAGGAGRSSSTTSTRA